MEDSRIKYLMFSCSELERAFNDIEYEVDITRASVSFIRGNVLNIHLKMSNLNNIDDIYKLTMIQFYDIIKMIPPKPELRHKTRNHSVSYNGAAYDIDIILKEADYKVTDDNIHIINVKCNITDRLLIMREDKNVIN